MLNVLLRDKYVAYAASISGGGALFYLYSIGHSHWLYNPLYYHLWNYADLIGANRTTIMLQRSFWLAMACFCLALAHVCFARKAKAR